MAVNPLVRQLGLQQVLERDTATIPKADDLTGDAQVESALAGHVRLAWARNKLGKQRIDIKLLSDLRARRGVYSAAQIAQMQANNGGMNIVWHPLTEVKCRAASAWIREIVLPVGEQPWGVDPTPIPDLPMPIKKSIVAKALKQAQDVMVQAAQAAQAAQQPQAPQGPSGPPGAPPGPAQPPQAPQMPQLPDGVGPPAEAIMSPQEFRDLVAALGEKLREDAENIYRKLAEKRAKRMERQIADRLAQGCYAEAMDAFVEDFVTYPAAILKGPIYTRHKTLKWGAGFKPVVSNDAQQTWERVSPFDIYPAPASKSPQDGDFIERIRFRREELFDLKGLPNYQDDQIDSALRDYTNGHLEGWLWTESERQRLEQETLFMFLSPPGVIDAINYWGSVPGWKLMSWGVKGKLEETREYECNVLLCGRYVLYAAMNPDPLSQRPYRKACYDEIPGAFWGRSIPDLASTPQQMCNAIACALADNLAIASGPMAWVHADRFADGEQSMEMFPWKLWQLKSDPTQGVNPGIGFFQPNDNSEKLMNTLDKWEIRADDATGIPRYTYGNERAGGSADTATGLSMLMNNAAKGLRRAIGNIDANVIAPTIGDTFTNEMLYNPDESIKGDNIVVPRGAAAILVRESAQQRRIQFLTMTANPIDSQIITAKYRAALLRETAASMELPVDDVVPSDEALDAAQQAQQQAMQAQQQAAMDAQQQAHQAEIQGQIAVETAKEQAKTQRESTVEQARAQRDGANKQSDVIGEVVKQAVAAALQQQTEKSAASAASKKIRYEYDEDGNLVAGELG